MDAHCLVYRRQYANRTLQWHLIHDPCDPRNAPDVVFDDVTFNPLLDPSISPELSQMLSSWGSDSSTSISNKTTSVAALLELLLGLYSQHQKEKIAALQDDRLLFELAMLEDLGCSEVLLSGAADGSQQACFSIPVDADLAPAQRLINCQQQQQGSHASSSQAPQQFMLQVAFRVGHGISSHAAPDLQLQYPQWAEQQLPPLALPAWDPHTSLVEYVPHVAERLSKHLQDSCPAAVLRFDLVEALAGVFGQPLEVNMQGSSAVKSSTATGSSSSFAGVSSSMGHFGGSSRTKSSSGSSAVFQLQFDQQPLLLFVEMPPSFPAEAPLLLLQSMRRLGADSYVTLSNIPWSPRWDADEMTARLFNFVKQQAPGILKAMEGGGSNGAL